MDAVKVTYKKSATKYDIMNFVYDCLLKNGWKTSFNYLISRPRRFMTKPLRIPDGNRSDFSKYLDYCYLLSHNHTAADEAARYIQSHGTSIYFSVVLYWLLIYDGVLSEKNLKFCQGYFSYKIAVQTSEKKRYRAGLHAWLSYYGAVMDTTIWQQENGLYLSNSGTNVPPVKGELPEGLNLVGFEEDKSLVKDYARKFARESGMTFYEWVDYHKKQADLLFNVRLMEHSAI